MYKHSRGHRPQNNHYRNRHAANRGRGGFRIKTFDPSQIINNAQPETREESYITKNSFSDFALANSLKQNIAKRGYTTPTPIQDQAIPVILQGRDTVGIAQTGTGKTAAFLIPLINKILSDRSQKVLVITPTRELATQIDSELRLFTPGLSIYSAVVIGGVSLGPQISHLRRNPHFVIGTPGRLLDLTNQRKLNLSQFRTVVLDEVDRMLDMGFISDIQKIIRELPQNRQSLFFSATLAGNVTTVMQQFTQSPTTISVKAQNSTANVDQQIVKTSGSDKFTKLQDLLVQKEFQKVLIFGRTKRGTDKLTRDLSKAGHKVASIHGNKSQNQRQRSLDQFKAGRTNILVATDVVARGIDVDNITHVINYELPETYEDYLHRIGRTGRAGKKGTALTFIV